MATTLQSSNMSSQFSSQERIQTVGSTCVQALDIIETNRIYRERFPKATKQMEEKLLKLIEDNRLDAGGEAPTDAVACFGQRQIIEMARDCFEKSRDKLIISEYFIDISENLEKVPLDCSTKSPAARDYLKALVRQFPFSNVCANSLFEIPHRVPLDK